MKRKAVIIGGSLAGLMHAIMLREHGWIVVILEKRDSTLVSQQTSHAAGIGPGPHFCTFMKRFDRIKRPISRGKGPLYICDRNGATSWNLPVMLEYTSWGLIYSILRANFDGSESIACPNPPQITASHESGYISGKMVHNITCAENERIQVHYKDVSTGDTQFIDSDIVVAADGSFSTARRLLFPEKSPKYAGYVAWRGTVPERHVSEKCSEYFDGCGRFYTDLPKGYIIIYKMPSEEGKLDNGQRVINWVWYQECQEGSLEFREAFIDIDGRSHLNTITRDLMRPSVWEKKKEAVNLFPPLFAEVLQMTKSPFLTKVNDISTPRAVQYDRIFFVGDALQTLRPHSAQSINQAAFHCLALEDVIQGKLTPADWERRVLAQSRILSSFSMVVGMYGLGYRLRMTWALLRCLYLLASQKLLGWLWRGARNKSGRYESWTYSR